MFSDRLQDGVDQVRETSVQRWLLAGSAVFAALTSSVVTVVASGGTGTWVVVAVAVVAIVAASQPDSTAGVVVIGIVCVHWLVLVDDRTTAWAMVVAIALFGFHTLLALMSATTATSPVHPGVLARWAVRSGIVAIATGAVWGLVVAFDGQDLAGNVLLTVAAFVVVAAFALAIRRTTATADPE